MRCQDNSKLRIPLPEVCKQTEIGAVPKTTGTPAWTPTPDQLPLAYDSASGILYFYDGAWQGHGLNALPEVNLSNLTNLDDVVRIPVAYTTGTSTVEGYVTLKELKKLL